MSAMRVLLEEVADAVPAKANRSASAPQAHEPCMPSPCRSSGRKRGKRKARARDWFRLLDDPICSIALGSLPTLLDVLHSNRHAHAQALECRTALVLHTVAGERMPSAKRPAADGESRPLGSTATDKQIAAAAHARKSKLNGALVQQQNAGALKEIALVSTEAAAAVGSGQSQGMSWSTAPLSLLNTYRISHALPTASAFTSPLHQARLTKPGIGKQSPTMARMKDKRRVSKEQLATSVRKHFNGAAVGEIDVVVELVYKVRHQDKAFRMRSVPAVTKK